MTPCRLIDTRPAPDRIGPYGAFGVNDTRNIAARGANGSCTIPDEATGLSLNVTALDATAPTFLTIWPSGPRPLASSLNPVPSAPPTPNAVNTQISGSGAFQIYNLQGAVNVIVDINGFYTKTSLQDLDFWVTDLYQAQPFVESSEDVLWGGLGTSASVILKVRMEAPHDGRVTVMSTAFVQAVPVEGSGSVTCLITTADDVPIHISSTTASAQQISWPNGGEGSLAGSRTFDIAAGDIVDYVLACQSYTSDGYPGEVYSGGLTALFTPAYG